MDQNRLYGLLGVIPFLLFIYLLMKLDTRYLDGHIIKLFKRRGFRLFLLLMMLFLGWALFKGQRGGLIFLL